VVGEEKGDEVKKAGGKEGEMKRMGGEYSRCGRDDGSTV